MYEFSDYLAHHGIMGMKWGKTQGPPYPLAPSAHSAAEKKANWRQSLASSQKSTGSRTSDAKKSPIRSLIGRQKSTGSRSSDAKKSLTGTMASQQKTTRVDKQAEKRIAKKNQNALASDQKETGNSFSNRKIESEKQGGFLAGKQIGSSASEKKSFSERFQEKKMEKQKEKLENIVNKGEAKDVLKVRDKLTTEQLHRAADRLNAENQVRIAGNNAQQAQLAGAQHINNIMRTGINYTKTVLEAYDLFTDVKTRMGGKQVSKSEKLAKEALKLIKNTKLSDFNTERTQDTIKAISQVQLIEKAASGGSIQNQKKK